MSNFSWDKLRGNLAEFPEIEVDKFVDYCVKMRGDGKNKFFLKLSEGRLAYYFKKVKDEGLTFDGKHVTLNSHGISYDYVAYKQKMFTIYPETLFDFQLVYQGDEFGFEKVNGEVKYHHKFANPFERTDQKIVGGYCVIKNDRGDFITTMTVKEFEKHRAVAKTDYIWNKWYREMCLKTLIKKSVKVHFDDIYENINEEDNKAVDLDKDRNKSFKEISIDQEIERAKAFIISAKSIDQLLQVKSSVADLGLSDIYEEKFNELSDNKE